MKKHIKIIFFAFCWIIGVKESQSCTCWPPLTIDSLDQLKGYDFIAHVKIIDDQDSTTNNYMTIGLLTIKIIELFKGEEITQIMEFDKNTSCDIEISNGEEWVLFGWFVNGKIAIGPCDRNEKYKKANELRDWKYDNGFYSLRQLRKFYQHPIPNYSNGKHLELYSNGQKEIEENYVNGKLYGERKIWYPSGVLFCRQYYINDTLDGKSEWFYPSGQIYDEDYYVKGKPCNVSRLYYDSTAKKDWFTDKFKTADDSVYFFNKKIQTQYEIIFDSYGREIISREYTRFGKIYKEVTIDPDRKFETVIYYHDNGIISSIMYSLNNKNYGHYQEYDEKGLPDRGWDYDKNGEAIK